MTEPRPLTDEERDIIAKSRRAFDGMLSVENVSRLMASERFYLERFAESDPLRHDRNFKNYVCDCGFWLDENLVNHGKTDRRIDAPLHHSRCPWRIAVETVAKLKEK